MIIVSMLFAPESPRWLVQHGHIDRARRVLQKTRLPDEVEEELLSFQEAVAYEAQNMSGVSYKYFFTDPSTRWRFFLAVVINFGQQLTGQGSLNNYSTIIYKKVFNNNSTIQLINAINATMGILFTLNASCKCKQTKPPVTQVFTSVHRGCRTLGQKGSLYRRRPRSGHLHVHRHSHWIANTHRPERREIHGCWDWDCHHVLCIHFLLQAVSGRALWILVFD
jgi:hypothetical protein